MTRAFLVVDDDADVLKAAQIALAAHGDAADGALSPDGLAERVTARAYDAVLLDMNFGPGDRSGDDGFAALAAVQAADPALAVVLMTTFGGVALAVEGLKRGAADFVLKPWRNEALAQALHKAAETTRARRAGEVLNLDAVERRAIERALALHAGNVSRAATALGLTRPALYRRMARHGL